MRKFIYIFVAGYVLIAGLFSVGFIYWPFLTSGTGGFSEKQLADNVTVSGMIVKVESKNVVYGYNVPELPRSPWSFTREQLVGKDELAKYHPDMPVEVEYSRTQPGISRLKGYGSGSVFVAERLDILKHTSIFPFLPLLIIAFGNILSGIRQNDRAKRACEAAAEAV